MGRKKKDSPDSYDLSLLSGKQYSKSNALINAKGKTSLFCQKLMAIGIQQAEEDEEGNLTTTIRGTDLRKIFGNKNGSFYQEIKELVEPVKGKPSLLDWRVIYTDDATERVEAINIISDAKFEDGVFSFSFNKKVKSQVWELKSNYTIFSLTETIPLKSIYSFRIFELLKAELDKQQYRAKKNGTYRPGDTYITDINLTDLKLKLGIIDPNTDRKILDAIKKDNPDFDMIEDLAKGQKDTAKYRRFSDFREATLEVAKKELEVKTSISFDYEQLKSGRGGRTTGIRFFIHSKQDERVEVIDTQEKPVSEISEAEKYGIAFQTQVMLGTELFSMEDVLVIIKAANYDMDRISNAYNLFKKSKTTIDNPTGWMIDAIKKDYRPSKGKVNHAFNSFPQNSYDFNALEEALLDN